MSMNVICSLVNTKYHFFIGKMQGVPIQRLESGIPLLMAVIHNSKCKIESILVF